MTSAIARASRPLVRTAELAYPFFFAAAFVLGRWAEANATVHELWRPLLVSQILVGVVFALLWVTLRRRRAAALLTCIALGLLASYTIPALILAAGAAWWWIAVLLQKWRGIYQPQPHHPPTRVAIAFSGALLLVALGASAVAAWPRLGDRTPLPVSARTEGGPDIFVLLLDGYPRDDTLRSEFRIDNSTFIADLSASGFEVAHQAATNYTKTWLTVASLLDARYVHDIPELVDHPDSPAGQMRLLHEAVEDGAVLDVLAGRSYEFVSIPSPVTTGDVFDGASVLSSGHLNGFEISVLSHSLLGRLYPEPIIAVLTADQRANVQAQLRLMREVASDRSDAPRLVLTHLMSPHPPFLLGQDPDYLIECFTDCDFWSTTVEELGISESEFAERLQTQLHELNAAVLESVAHIASMDPSAVIIVMSDHGLRHEFEASEEHFRSFFAARTPGYDSLFPDDIAPVNVFRRLLSSVFGEELPDLPYEAWRSAWLEPLVLTRAE